MSSDLDFEQRIRLVGLYDIYGGLLTEKQQKCMEMHLFNDLSLSEIADEYEYQLVAGSCARDIRARGDQ